MLSWSASVSRAATSRADSEAASRATVRISAPGASIGSKQPSEDGERIGGELMDRSLSKAERIQRLRELAKSGEDVPDELMDQALRKLMERITE